MKIKDRIKVAIIKHRLKDEQRARLLAERNRAMGVMMLVIMVASLMKCSGEPLSTLTAAFCGPRTDKEAQAMAVNAGIDETFGICHAPDWSTYTVLNPTVRYGPPEEYVELLLRNKKYGMKTFVYDARAWTDPASAVAYWLPYVGSIAGWDMGDEPDLTQFPEMLSRWKIVMDNVFPATGVKPYVNHVGQVQYLDAWSEKESLSFDQYLGDRGVGLALTFNSQVGILMCGVNAYYQPGIPAPTPASVKKTMKDLVKAGCDQLLIFGGPVPDGTNFGPITITSNRALANAVRDGAKS